MDVDFDETSAHTYASYPLPSPPRSPARALRNSRFVFAISLGCESVDESVRGSSRSRILDVNRLIVGYTVHMSRFNKLNDAYLSIPITHRRNSS